MPRKKKEAVITAFKGFEHDFKCKDFQYEVGKEYETKGEINCCNNGFHACKVPLDVFKYYAPVNDNAELRKYAVVEQSGDIDEENDKTASSKIKIKAELSIMDLVKCHVDYIKEHTKKADTNTGDYSAATNTGDWSAATNTGYYSAATNTGNYSAATNTGDYSAATNTGDRSAATNTGYWSAATNTGDRSAATNTGYWSAATNTGYWSKAEVKKENSAAFAFGYQAKARAKDGWIIIVDWRLDKNQNKYIHNIHSAKVGGKILNKKIKSNVWYWFEDGELKSEG